MRRAQDFVSNPTPSMKIGTRPGGVNALDEIVMEKVFMDMNNGFFAVQVLDGSEAGALKTFFPGEGGPADWLEYWNKQNITTVIQ